MSTSREIRRYQLLGGVVPFGDGRHSDALTMLAHLGPGEQVLTTNLVVGETWTFLRRKDGHRTALAFLDRIETLQQKSELALHRITFDQEEKAWTWHRHHNGKRYSFVDATSFQLPGDARPPLREALAFDQDFAAAGFLELRP